MSRRFPWGRVIVITLVLALLALTVLVAGIGSALPLDHATLVIDGETIPLSGLPGEHAAFAAVVIAAALLLTLIAAAMAVVLALLLAALAVGVALVAALAAMALLMSPLLLIVWLIWRLARRPAADRPRVAVA